MGEGHVINTSTLKTRISMLLSPIFSKRFYVVRGQSIFFSKIFFRHFSILLFACGLRCWSGTPFYPADYTSVFPQWSTWACLPTDHRHHVYGERLEVREGQQNCRNPKRRWDARGLHPNPRPKKGSVMT